MTFFFVLGLLLAIAGSIWFLIVAFKESVLWGLGCLILPIVSFVFLILNFSKAWKPFALNIIGILVMIPGILSMDSEMQNARAARPVPLQGSSELDDMQKVSLIMKLKESQIKSNMTLGVVYVPANEIEKASQIMTDVIKETPKQ